MPAPETPTAAVLIIGNEILSGRTQDSNLNMIAKKLGAIGVRLCEARVVPDVENDIVAAVNDLRARYTYVFTTGGIGPTHDDITAASVAKAFGVRLAEHPDAAARLLAYYTKDNLNEARRRMAQAPEGAALIDNPISAAPGFRIENVHVLAGVPDIAAAMMDTIAATLKHGPAIHSIAVSGAVAESRLADDLRILAARWPQLDIGSYPWFRQGHYGTALVVRGTDQAAVAAAAEAVSALIEKYGATPARE
ncbi:MAG TPA: competence/damage-inducible protein A [Alphaproteobacteria bacterium]|nr:competence/damage-inducible protein A [Alphaproteobacteria bacterium]